MEDDTQFSVQSVRDETSFTKIRLPEMTGWVLVSLDWQSAEIPVECIAGVLVALDSALARLSTLEQRLGKVVELRFFAGLTVEEVAAVLVITSRSVVRDWNKARLFLHDTLREP